MTTQDTNISNETTLTIAQYGKEIGALLELSPMPESCKRALFEVIQELPLEHVEPIYQALQINLEENIALELSPEYQEEVSAIDQATIEELDGIINPA